MKIANDGQAHEIQIVFPCNRLSMYMPAAPINPTAPSTPPPSAKASL